MNIVCTGSLDHIFQEYNMISRHPLTIVLIRFGEITIPVIGKWDTGADISCISLNTVRALALTPQDQAVIRTADGRHQRTSYLVDLNIGNDIWFNELRVVDGNIDDQKIGMLIGIDVISHGDFSLHTSTGKTTLYFKLVSKT